MDLLLEDVKRAWKMVLLQFDSSKSHFDQGSKNISVNWLYAGHWSICLIS